MILEEKEISEKLSSADMEVLNSCKAYLVELSLEEKGRNSRAEDKAQIILNICGVGATILVGFAGLALGRPSFSLPPTVVLPVLAAIILIAKSAFYSLKALQPVKGFVPSEKFAFDVQEKTPIEALRYDITNRIWLYQRNRQFSTSKLFYLDRAIRNFAAFIVPLLISFVLVLVTIPRGGTIRTRWTVGFGIALLIASLALDPVTEWFGKKWVRRKRTGT
jgi:hypothetical protein